VLSVDDLLSEIATMEREMKKAAKALEFERAAELRDRVSELKKIMPDSKWL
jgi:excinuclease ABC subunit B